MKKTKTSRVAVAMSGGVDSSVAAALLLEQGFDCFGVTMLIEDSRIKAAVGAKRVCYSLGQQGDVQAAAKQARELGIPHFVVDLRQAFQDEVVDYFRQGYLDGRTPNPCIRCNERIKFGALIRETREVAGDFDFFATGHFSRLRQSEHGWQLLRGVDQVKDQSYFLYRLPRTLLAGLLFPLGTMTKARVRKKAGELGLSSHNRPQSVDFLIPQAFPLIFGDPRPGVIRDLQGRELGKHPGIVHFTVGQRRGIGVAATTRLYVHHLDPETATVVVGPRDSLMYEALEAGQVNWVSRFPPQGPIEADVKIRLNQEAVPARVVPIGDARARVEFADPVFAVAPGQSAVFYQGDLVLGGGVIQRGFAAG